ncbi:DUF485 domain-containing protein [Chungangia koreensis]|uniref:DUF485 domain-containing protein n=1 Tax=Chungangia koreensis TaxID=752657 RepID=A0ABV8X2F0_9LACT
MKGVYAEDAMDPNEEGPPKSHSVHKSGVDFERIAESSRFREFMAKKKKFIVPLTVFFLIFYFTLPVMTSYSDFLNTPVIGDISWAWLFALAQFIMTWVLCTMYAKKSASFDDDADVIIEEEIVKGGGKR